MANPTVNTEDKLTTILAYCPGWLADRLKREASEQRRSVSSQVVLILEHHFKKLDK